MIDQDANAAYFDSISFHNDLRIDYNLTDQNENRVCLLFLLRLFQSPSLFAVFLFFISLCTATPSLKKDYEQVYNVLRAEPPSSHGTTEGVFHLPPVNVPPEDWVVHSSKVMPTNDTDEEFSNAPK